MSTIIKPLITEKAASLAKENQYIFIVHKKANKVEIKKEIQNQYKVNVASVNTARYIGKKIVRYTRESVIKGKRHPYKKATITLQKGQNIDLQSQTL